MALHVALTHETHYRYDRWIGMGPQVDPAAAGAALPDAHPQLLADGGAEDPLRQLAAGPVRQLPRPRRASRSRPSSFSVTVDLVADMAVINPFDFFVEESAEEWPFDYERR